MHIVLNELANLEVIKLCFKTFYTKAKTSKIQKKTVVYSLTFNVTN